MNHIEVFKMGVDFDKLRKEVIEKMQKGKSGDVGNELRKAFEKIEPLEFVPEFRRDNEGCYFNGSCNVLGESIHSL